MRIMIASDAFGQTNGVVTTLENTIAMLTHDGHVLEVISPADFPTLRLPFYQEIRLPVHTVGFARLVRDFKPDAIHIAVEGPVGLAARHYCARNHLPFTTAYHTDFPAYLSTMVGVPEAMTWRYLQWFHHRSSAVLVSTRSIETQLHQHGITHTREWTRGFDTSLFRPDERTPNVIPKYLYVGRVSREKNIEAFLDVRLPFRAEYHVVGSGPILDDLKSRYPDVTFHGKLTGRELADQYRSADVFVFPSRSDTFGLVMIEAMACGTPVAAYPVKGPVDVVGDGGVLNADLGTAMMQALAIDRQQPTQQSSRFSWRRATDQFLAALVPFPSHGDADT